MLREPDVLKKAPMHMQQKSDTNDSSSIRDPIKKSKAEVQTLYITSGYAWTQSDSSIILYINFENANQINQDNCTLDVHSKSFELNILGHSGANRKFRINQLYHPVIEGKFVLKFKENKIVVRLFKETPNKKWPDLRIKSTQTIYNHLERLEKSAALTQVDMDTPFNGSDFCAHHDQR